MVDYLVVGRQQARETAFVKDISNTGMCFVVCEDLPFGTVLELRIFLPHSNEPVEIKGSVVWIGPSAYFKGGKRRHFDLGVEFGDMSVGDRKILEEYVSHFDKEGGK